MFEANIEILQFYKTARLRFVAHALDNHVKKGVMN